MKNTSFTFKHHGWLGIGLICFVECCLLIQHHNYFAYKISIWATPLCWLGYVMLLDAIIFRLKGNSLLCNRRREFYIQMPLSIAFWLLFEFYNLHLANWEYQGLPKNRIELCIGMGLAFALIMPGMFQTTELIKTLKFFRSISDCQSPRFKQDYIYQYCPGILFYHGSIAHQQRLCPLSLWAGLDGICHDIRPHRIL